MRLVIPYRKTNNDGVELRYAIRSMVKHFKPLSGVLLIGDSEEWYMGDHIPYADLKGEKERSMQLKVLQAPDDIFLYSNDDYFAAEDFSIDMPNYYDTDCRDMAARSPVDSYRRMYNNCLPHWKNFDVHVPMIMHKNIFKASYYKMDSQTPIKTTYGNFANGNRDYLCDCKIKGEHSLEEIIYATKDRPFFSTHDNSINADMITFFESLYPNVSPYEK